MQDRADDFRQWRMCRLQRAAQKRVAARDFWRREIGRPWQVLWSERPGILWVLACFLLLIWCLA